MPAERLCEIRCGPHRAAFEARHGYWRFLGREGDLAGGYVRRAAAPFDLIVDGRRFFGGMRSVARAEEIGNGRGVRLVFEKDRLRVTHEVAWAEGRGLLEQSVEIEVLPGPARRLTAVHFLVPGLVIGRAEDCLVQAPAQFLAPDAPYAQVAAKPLDVSVSEPLPHFPQGWLEPAPDQSPGLVAVENRALGQVVSVWQHGEIATTFPTIDGHDGLVDVGHRHQLAAWLRPGVKVRSDGHAILLTEGTLEDHLAEFRRPAYGDRLVQAGGTPGWVEGARLLQINPRSIASWTARLDRIRDLGFNLLYLMPVWSWQGEACYAIHDHFEIDRKVGTKDELRAFVAEAHGRGLRVIFDFIPQGIGDSSPFIEKRPEWLVRDGLGRPFGSHGWGPKPGAPKNGHTYSLDWGNPAYRRFALEWALWNVETFGVDGFRTDAMHWKEPNFDRTLRRPAWETMFGGVRLAEELGAALRKRRPDALLLSEVWGPIFQRSHDATYQDGWILSHVNKAWLEGRPILTGGQWSRWLALEAAARPPGIRHASFTANHDMPHLAHLARKSPLGNALSFVHAFSAGFPFVYYEEPEGREAFFTRLMAERAKLAGWGCRYAEVAADSPDAFTALWTGPGKPPHLAAANMGLGPVRARLAVRGGRAAPSLAWASEGVAVGGHPGGGVVADLPSGGYALIRI